MKFKFVAIAACIAFVVVACGGGGDDEDSGDAAADLSPTATPGAAKVESPCPSVDAPAPKDTRLPAPPADVIDPAKTYTAEFETSCGAMTFTLDPKSAQVDVNNFVYLARQGFYDGTVFHRIIGDFMIQGGDPTGSDMARAGTGGPGSKYTGTTPTAPYQVGSLAMANSGDPSSNGSQFFIVTGPQGVQLPPNYSLFGQIASGQDVLAKIASVPTTTSSSGEESWPVEAVVIEKVTITES
jgi:cyclophilin family peptidyl-prolyl cis-trans isomerase